MNEEKEIYYNPQEHPWLEMPVSNPEDEDFEVIRYSLDEIRVG